jgi:hypothetical protein
VRVLLKCFCGADWWRDLGGIGAVAVLRRDAASGFLRDDNGCCSVEVQAGLAVEDTPSGALKSEV